VFLGSQPTVLTDASWVAVVPCPLAPGPLDQGWLTYWLLLVCIVKVLGGAGEPLGVFS
jgi:hypothetical protein